MKLDNSIAAVVTGGASGLGAATARALAARGVRVAIFDMSDAAGEKVSAEIGGVFCKVNVADPASVAAGLEKARAAHGQERVCVNCAGIVIGEKTVVSNRETGAFAAHDPAAFARVVSVNLNGSFIVASQSAAGMAGAEPLTADGERGVIVFTSSIAAVEGQIGQVAYSASKGGVAGMVLPMARDLSRKGIRANAIMPGLFQTAMLEGLDEEIQKRVGATVPFPSRTGKPSEYAALVMHICENEMLNGTAIRLDGAIRLTPR
ncbi:MAG: SDR family NAD(P)-dependent oxidoreductase [Rhodobiaceae bacterium]|nr:SDR family NAD(P)-dependent oxidoreductase [Rhodobiaceae bacterium]